MKDDRMEMSHRALLAMAVLGGLVCALPTSTFAAALPLLRKSLGLSSHDVAVLAGGVMCGQMLGTLVVGSLAERYGRRFVFGLSSSLYLVSFPLVCAGMEVLFVGRILQGLATGWLAALLPVVLVEGLPQKNRGSGTVLSMLSFTIGLALGAVCGIVFARFPGFDRALLLVPLPFVVAFTCLAVLQHYSSGHPVETSVPSGGLVLSRLLRQWRIMGPALIVAVATALLGTGPLLLYSCDLFGKFGLDPLQVHCADAALKGTNVVMTAVGVFLVDRFERRQLMSAGLIGTTVAWLLWAFLSCVRDQAWLSDSIVGVLAAMCAMLYLGSFALGPGLCVSLVVAELLPSSLRTRGAGLAFFCNHLSGWSLVMAFPVFTESFGVTWVFVVLAFFSSVFLFACRRYLPETSKRNISWT